MCPSKSSLNLDNYPKLINIVVQFVWTNPTNLKRNSSTIDISSFRTEEHRKLIVVLISKARRLKNRLSLDLTDFEVDYIHLLIITIYIKPRRAQWSLLSSYLVGNQNSFVKRDYKMSKPNTNKKNPHLHIKDTKKDLW